MQTKRLGCYRGMRWLLSVALKEIVQVDETTLISQLDQPKKSA